MWELQTSSESDGRRPMLASIGILAWNEEEAIGATIASIFRQSWAKHLHATGSVCEIVCVANGCTDKTADAAKRAFQRECAASPTPEVWICRVAEVSTRGKANAWNTYIHQLSSRRAATLILMDGDILLRNPDTLRNMHRTLDENPAAVVAASRPLKDISLKPRKSLRDRISLATSTMNAAGASPFCAQLYAIRAEAARNIHMPVELGPEDGFIKAVVCTDFFTRPFDQQRLVRAENADHVFQSYTRPVDIFRNQKRQMLGQTLICALVDQYLPGLTLDEKRNLAVTLRAKDEQCPGWLRELVQARVREAKHLWKLFPGALTFRFVRLAKLNGWQRLTHLPAAIIGAIVTLLTCAAARRSLMQGVTCYWPDTRSANLASSAPPPIATNGAESPMTLTGELK